MESTFGPSTQAVEYAMQDSGMPRKVALHACVDAEDKFNTLPSKANKLGSGEAPARTCGFSIDHNRFQRFGCLGTVNVLHKNLVARDDGSVAVASAPPPTLSSVVGALGQRRVGKIGRIKSLPCFFLRSGGGLTTASFNGIEFGGYLFYVPALDNETFKGGRSWRLDLSASTHGCGQNDCGHRDDP